MGTKHRPKLQVGEKLNMITIVGYEGDGKWKYLCDCGNYKSAMSRHIRDGMVKSCGCLMKERGKKLALSNKTHGQSKTRTYQSWKSMIHRCQSPKNGSYPWYGGRGISVCERWMVFENFLHDMGERPEGTSIDRICSDKGYQPDNCKWSTLSEQYANRRNHNQYTDKKVI